MIPAHCRTMGEVKLACACGCVRVRAGARVRACVRVRAGARVRACVRACVRVRAGACGCARACVRACGCRHMGCVACPGAHELRRVIPAAAGMRFLLLEVTLPISCTRTIHPPISWAAPCQINASFLPLFFPRKVTRKNDPVSRGQNRVKK